MNPIIGRAMQIAIRYGQPAAEAFIRQAQAGYAAIRNAPQLAPKGVTGPFAPNPVLNPTTGYKIQYPISHADKALRGRQILEYTPSQVYGAYGAAAAPAALGMAAMSTRDPSYSEGTPASQSLFSQLDRSASAVEPRPLTTPGGRPTEPSFEPGYEGNAGRRLSGELMAMQPEPGYGMPPAARAAVNAARAVMPQKPPMPPPRARDEAPAPMSSRDLWERYNRTGSAADFVRADAATQRPGRAEGGGLDPMAGLMPPDMATMPVDAPLPQPMDMAPPAPAMEPKAPAGGAGGKDAAINKALDIIHKLISGQRI